MSNNLLIEIKTALVAILSILTTAIIANYSIRNTSKETRVSTTHEKMSSCLVQTLDIIWETMHLLDDVANRANYYTFDTEEFIETAYERYWKNLSRLTEDNRALVSQQILYFPKKLVNTLKEINQLLNELRYEAKNVKPNDKHIYPDTSNIKSVMEREKPLLRDFREQARAYIGSEDIEPITPLSELPSLETHEIKKRN